MLLASIDFSTADHITATLCIADGTGRLLCYDATMNGQIARTGFRYQDLYLLLRVLEIVRGAYQDAWDSATSDLLTAAGSVKTKFGIEANSRPVGLTKSDDGPPSDWDILVGDSQAEELIEVKSGAISKADREVFWRRLRRELAQIEQRRGRTGDRSSQSRKLKDLERSSTGGSYLYRQPTGNQAASRRLKRRLLN